jgi:hypothetical protein
MIFGDMDGGHIRVHKFEVYWQATYFYGSTWLGNVAYGPTAEIAVGNLWRRMNP